MNLFKILVIFGVLCLTQTTFADGAGEKESHEEESPEEKGEAKSHEEKGEAESHEEEHGNEVYGNNMADAANNMAGAAKGERVTRQGSKTFSLTEISKHNTGKDCWLLLNKNEVWDVTSYLNSHPGGKAIIVRYAGTDATKQFNMFHKSSILRQYRGRYLIGYLEGTNVDAGKQQVSKPTKPTVAKPAKPPAAKCETTIDVDKRCNPAWTSYCTDKTYQTWMAQNCAKLCCYATIAKEAQAYGESGEKESKEEEGSGEKYGKSGEKESKEEEGSGEKGYGKNGEKESKEEEGSGEKKGYGEQKKP